MTTGFHGSPTSVKDLYRTCYKGDIAEVEGRFCRLFTPPEVLPDTSPRHLLNELGKTNGPMDEQNAADPIGDSNVPAGFTFFGQFVDHDITLDTVSQLDSLAVPGAIRNMRTPSLDLDCVYAGGRDATPYLYKPDGRLITRPVVDVDNAAPFRDLLRVNVGGNIRRAVIGDPRNDENPFISQLQLGMIEFHNHVFAALPATEHRFEDARDTVIHYYHRVILEDFLPRIIDNDLLEDICIHGNCYYKIDQGRQPCMPVEFAVAAYRYGHSQVRARYNYNDNQLDVDVFQLGAFRRVQHKIDWKYLFELNGGADTQMARKIDTALPHALMAMPMRITGIEGDSLAARNLRRGLSFRLPSGQAIARKMEADGKLSGSVLEVSDELKALGFKQTPLWYYCLQEAQTIGSGNKLGPVGGRIVAEVLVGLLNEYRNRTGKGLDYLPAVTVPQQESDRFQIIDLLTYAEVV